VKKFVLVRGDSGRLYLYNLETYEYMMKCIDPRLEFVVDSDDPKELKRFQYIANNNKPKEPNNVS